MSLSSASSSASSASSKGSRGRSMPKERSSQGRIEKSRHRRDGPSSSSQKSRDQDMDLTEEEDVEAITPPSTWGKDDRRWVPTTTNEGNHSLMALTSVAAGGPLPKGVDDDDMFKAALALCGLGRRT